MLQVALDQLKALQFYQTQLPEDLQSIKKTYTRRSKIKSVFFPQLCYQYRNTINIMTSQCKIIICNPEVLITLTMLLAFSGKPANSSTENLNYKSLFLLFTSLLNKKLKFVNTSSINKAFSYVLHHECVLIPSSRGSTISFSP